MGPQIEFRRNVGVVVTGPASFGSPHSEPPPVYIDEAEFYKATGMRASAPARVALIRLMKEDVTVKSLSRIWRDELEFNEDHFTLRVDHWVPKFTMALMLGFSASFLGSLLMTKSGQAAGFLVFFGAIMIGAAFFFSLLNQYIPYKISVRIAPMVERVNAELPDILSEWKRSAAPLTNRSVVRAH